MKGDVCLEEYLRPNRGVSSASWCQRAHEGSESGFVEGLAGGSVLLPTLEEDVIDPRVMRHMSCSWTSMTPVWPSSTMWMILTAVCSGVVYERLVTVVSVKYALSAGNREMQLDGIGSRQEAYRI